MSGLDNGVEGPIPSDEDNPQLLDEEVIGPATGVSLYEDLEDLRPFLRNSEAYLRSLWYDPRFGIRFAVGVLQLLQSEFSIEEISKMTIEDVKPLDRL